MLSLKAEDDPLDIPKAWGNSLVKGICDKYGYSNEETKAIMARVHHDVKVFKIRASILKIYQKYDLSKTGNAEMDALMRK